MQVPLRVCPRSLSLWNKITTIAMKKKNDLISLYKADKQERINQPRANTTEYKAMRARDLERRKCVMEIVASNELHTAEDYYYAAHIMNHGDTPEDAMNAHRLAL